MYHYTVRDALDVSLAMSANARIEDNPKVVGLAQVPPPPTCAQAWNKHALCSLSHE